MDMLSETGWCFEGKVLGVRVVVAFRSISICLANANFVNEVAALYLQR